VSVGRFGFDVNVVGNVFFVVVLVDDSDIILNVA
jgi:hypothetical protein